MFFPQDNALSHKSIAKLHKLHVYFSFLSKGIILWIELTWPENLANTDARHTETLERCFDLVKSQQQCIPWSPPLETKPATTEPKLYDSANNPYRAQVRPNQLVMVIALEMTESYVKSSDVTYKTHSG